MLVGARLPEEEADLGGSQRSWVNALVRRSHVAPGSDLHSSVVARRFPDRQLATTEKQEGVLFEEAEDDEGNQPPPRATMPAEYLTPPIHEVGNCLAPGFTRR